MKSPAATHHALTADDASGPHVRICAERADDAITMDDATRIARAVGWPPPRLDAEGALRAPTANELARWQSVDPSIVDTMEWPEVGEEIEHRSPAIYATALAAQRATVLALRARDCDGAGSDDLNDGRADDAPITAAERAEWDRVGRVLAAYPASLRRILAALSTVEGDEAS